MWLLTNISFLGCGFKSLGFRVLSPMGAARAKRNLSLMFCFNGEHFKEIIRHFGKKNFRHLVPAS